jgi:3-oxoacyl-[acyl-carrier protein] reductase
VKAYQSLIAEDRKWVESGDDEWAVMTPDQRAAYWIYHLRDLAVGQWSDPGSCRVVDDVGAVGAGGKKPNAAAELKKLGMAAVPHLIAHLDDPRPTRCKGHWRSYWPDGHYLLRYGDCCQQVFEAVTGHTLTTETYPMQAKKGTEVKAAAEKWWRDYQAKGEKLVLIEGTAAGTRDSGGHAEMLAAKYPDAALDAIRTGARASKDGWARAALVSAAAGLTGEGVTAFLWEEADGLFPRPRVRAAAALAARGDPAGAKALVREWDRLAGETDADWSDRHFLALELVAAVAGTNDPAAVRALGVGLTDRPVEVRSTVIERLAGAGKDLRGWPLTRETADAVEDVLAGLLADREEETSASSRGDKSVRDPMLGDLAAEALAGRLGEPKLFDNTAPLQVRERQRLETKNAWLKRRGKDSVPVPARRTVVPAPDARVRPLVRAVVEAGDAAGRRAAVGVLEQLGLPALPAIRKAADGLAADHPARADLRSLAGRLALVVAETRFTDDSAKPPDAARRRVDELRGRPVTAEGFLGLLRDLSGELPEGTRGVKLTVERVGDDAGVLLLVTLVPDRPARPARPGLAPQLSYGSRVVIGEKSLGGRARRIGRAGRTEAEPGRDRLVGVRRPPADRPEGRAGRVPVRSRALRRSAVDDAGREGSVDLGINGRHAVVCASSRGLGRACALELARAGCTVVINGRDRAALDRTADEIRAETGATVIPVAADVGTPDGQAALVGAATQVDILVTNNAGPPFKDFRQVDRTALLAGVVANMAAPIELVQRVIGGMVERRFGRVVNITSGSVKMPLPGLDLSSGARAGLTAFLAEVARQVAHANVTINCLLPGAFDTRRLRSSIEAAAGRAGVDPESVAAERKSAIPAKRFGDPAEFGAACALLCSAQAGYITGQSLLIDGGAFPGTL